MIDDQRNLLREALVNKLNALASRLTAQGEYEAVDLIDTVVARATAMPERDLLREALSALDAIQSDAAHVIDFYNRNGPTWTGKDGHEYDDMSSVLGRAEIVIQQTSAAADKIRAALTQEKQT